jgi:hypothetical protein
VDRTDRPPAYAWDWLARQRLLWREIRKRLAVGPHESAPRYRHAEIRPDVVTLLREDYPRDPLVRDVVRRVVADIAFLGRTDEPFERLGVRHAPRGMRWWWEAITGEPIDHIPSRRPPRTDVEQLTLDEVHEGIGG